MEELEFLDSQKLQAHSMTSKSMDSDAATQPPPRKRTKAHSCNSCRRRKLKCDRGWPCGACRDRNEAHLCTWQEGVVPERVGRDAPDNMMLIQRMATLESKFDALLDKIDRMGDSKSGKELSIVQSETHNLEEMQSNSISDASFMLSMFLQPTDLAQRRRVLSRMLHNTPNIKLLASILDSFNGQMHCINCIVDKKCVEAHLNDVVLLQNEVMHKKDFVDKLNKDELTRYIYSVSSCLAICSLSLVISRDTKLDILRNDKDSLPLFQRYIRESLIGLSSLPVLDEPNINFVIIMVTLVCCLGFSRSPGMVSCLIGHAVQVAFLLDMDVEPPPDMPFEEASRSVQLYCVLCTQDWFATMTIKRYPLIPFDKERFPSIFGTTEQRSKYLSPYQQLKLKLAHLYCRSSPLMMPRAENYAYICQLHDEAMEILSVLPSMWPSTSDHAVNMFETSENLHRMIGLGAVHYLLLRIHLPFYMRGWNDSNYVTSRETCYSSARSLLHLFRQAFSWKVGKSQNGDPSETLVPDDVSVPARMWYFSHWCTAAALLLLKHLAMLHERSGQQSWDYERECIVVDLCIMSRLFQYLSSISSFAREGYDAMQRVASHALHNDHEAKPLSGENCVTHWADRIMPSRTGSPSFEPMSVLSTLSKRNEFKYIPDKGQERAASNSGSSDSSLNSAVCPPTQSPGFSTPSKSVSDSTSPSVSDEELDTFWAKFVGPTSKQGSMISPLSLDMNASSGLPEPSAFLMQSHHSAPVRVDPDMALMFQQEFTESDPLHLNSSTITPFTDDFLRSMDLSFALDPSPATVPVPQT